MTKCDQEQAMFVPRLLLSVSFILAFSYPISLIQAASPITSSGLNTQVSAPIAVGGQTQFNITGGTRPGSGPNLFHSFGNFNVPNNNIANFLNDTGLPTTNILGRVTDGNISNIFGTIQTTGFGNANLFLMNPAGFLFGPTATVNVGGMMTFTTADYMRLADGTRFNAIPNAAADALLSAAPIAAFGFLGSNPGAITVQGSQLSVADGTGISLVGGNITVQSGTLDNGTVQPARLSAPGGQINLVSVGTPQHPNKGGEISATDFSPSPTLGFKTLGTVTIADATSITTSTDGLNGLNGGTVLIRGGEFVLSNSSIALQGLGPSVDITTNGGNLEVHAETVSLDQATISTSSNTARGGNVTFTNLDNLISSNTIIETIGGKRLSSDAVARSGSLQIGSSTTTSVILHDTTLSAAGFGGFAGPQPPPNSTAGDITISGRQILINGGSLDTSAASHSVRRGGPITLNGDEINLTNQASLVSIDTTGGGGAGTIILQGLTSTVGAPAAAKSVSINNSTLRVSSNGGPGGEISIHGEQITLDHASLLAYSANKGGTINLSDIGTLKSTNSRLDASGDFAGGGAISVGSLRTQSIRLEDTVLSVAGLASFFTGPGGTIDITAANLFNSVRSTFDASSANASGGTILIHAGRLSVTNGSTVNAQGAGPGQDGTIQFVFGKKLTVQDSVVIPDATIVSGWEAQ